MIRERRILSPGEPGSDPSEVPEESGGEGQAGSWEQGSGGEGQAGSWEQGAGIRERAEGRERRQALKVWSQGSTQEITPAILHDQTGIVRTR